MLKKLMSLLFGIAIVAPAYSLNQIIIKFKPTEEQKAQLSSNQISQVELNAQLMQPLTNEKIQLINNLANAKFFERSAIATGAHVIDTDQDLSPSDLNNIVAKLQNLPNVEYVEVSKFYTKNSDIPEYGAFQWDMSQTTKGENAGLNNNVTPLVYGDNFQGLLAYWRTIFTGISNVNPGALTRVGVIDTGYTNHPNFITRLMPTDIKQTVVAYGYDFISDCRIGGSCPTSTPSSQAIKSPAPNGLDLGDYLTQDMINASQGFFRYCPVSNNSSWHGTHVTGTIVGTRYSSRPEHVLGGAFGSMVEPIRALGKCGGTTQDIANAIMWAANLHPKFINLYPVDVINMSLGGGGVCSGAMADAIAQVTKANPKIIFVIAAGNSGADVKNFTPANCPKVISVAAASPVNNLSWYSNFGNTTITATGGDQNPYSVTSDNIQYVYKSGVYSSLWGSKQEYNSTDKPTWGYYNGTSMAAPHVAALVADIISYVRNAPNIYNRDWDFNKISNILQSSARNDYIKCNNTGFFAKKYNIGGCVNTGTIDAESALKLTQKIFKD